MKKHLFTLALLFAVGTTYAVSQDQSAQPNASAGSATQASTGADSNKQVDDQALTSDIHHHFGTDAAFKNIQIAVSNGQVDLTGAVPSKDDIRRAKEMASAVPGVRSVREHLKVDASASPAATATGNTSMSETEHNTAGSIAGNSDAEDASAKGQSTYTGRPSTSGPSANAAQSSSTQTAGSSAGQAGTATGGVSGATATGATTDKSGASSNSATTVGAPTAGAAAGTGGQTSAIPSSGTSTTSSDALKMQLDSAFQSEPTLSNSHVMVNVTDTNIELTGTVPTPKERLTAKRIAQSYAGNRKVDDNLTVSGRGPSSGNNPGMGHSNATGSTDMGTGAGSNTSTTGTTPTTKDPSSNPPASNNDNPKTEGDQSTSSPR